MRSTELFVGSFLFVIFSALSAVSFLGFSAELAERVVNTALPIGTSISAVKFRGECVGKLHSDIDLENHRILIDLESSIQEGNNTATIAISSICLLNPLDQLASCSITSSMQGQKFGEFQIHGPNPVSIHLNGLSSIPMPRNLQIPGPIEFLNHDGELALRGLNSSGGDVKSGLLSLIPPDNCPTYATINLSELTPFALTAINKHSDLSRSGAHQ